MNDAQTLAYVQAAATALELPLDAERAARVAAHLQRTAAMAQGLQAFPLDDEAEPAEVYCPAPFPAPTP
ncbi:MAG: DUF4089 domain-containing protein [Hydrogenophaga sp.]|nr:DUF4089 domain-containing protein [Hydrogenophaga sp.]